MPACLPAPKQEASQILVLTWQALRPTHVLPMVQVEEDDNFMDLVNPNTRFESPASGDANMRILQKGEVLQLERKG